MANSTVSNTSLASVPSTLDFQVTFLRPSPLSSTATGEHLRWNFVPCASM